MSAEYDLRLYAVNDIVTPLAFDTLQDLGVSGRGSALLDALFTLQNEYQGLPLAGVLFLTDGANNTGTTESALLEDFALPVFTVGAGERSRYRDIQIAEKRVVNFAFLRSPVTVDFTLKSWGYQGTTVPVILKQGNQVVATTMVPIAQPEFTAPISFTFTPREIGTFSYAVETPLQVGEMIESNNRKEFSLHVIRDKIRILIVSGRPSWSYRFLRRALKSDPTIDLISFIILRTPSDVVNVPERQLSLIPFPTNRLFTRELGNFDLLIFDNFSYTFYFPLPYLEHIKRFVAEGGAFAMFGGDQSFGDGGYAQTPLEEILPVEMLPKPGGYAFLPGKMELTREGETHPITQITVDGEENRLLWEEMPVLKGFNRVLRVKPGAIVLGNYALAGKDQRFPLLVAMKYKKGRTLALLTDQTWRWNFEMVGKKKGNRHYLRFVRQMIRWLVKDPTFKQVQVLTSKETYQIGEEAEIRVRVFNNDFSPATDAVLTLTVKDTQAGVRELSPAPAAQPGEYVATYQPDHPGIFTVRAVARSRQARGSSPSFSDQILGSDETLFRMVQPQIEFENAAPGEALLRKMADLTGGRYFSATTPWQEIREEIRKRLAGKAEYRIVEERPLELRNTLWAFLALLSLFSLEWIIRRRGGLA
ncbi:MAG: hypothetical protein D6736_02530 [Nitrospinota bacterium]|nr:MAG: hypothetical protein D6736_02530 [Nitrospinota bacterium]